MSCIHIFHLFVFPHTGLEVPSAKKMKRRDMGGGVRNQYQVFYLSFMKIKNKPLILLSKVVLPYFCILTPWFTVYSLLSNSCRLLSALLSLFTLPPTFSLFTATWLHLNKRLTPAYRIKLISTKQGSVQEGCGGWWG